MSEQYRLEIQEKLMVQVSRLKLKLQLSEEVLLTSAQVHQHAHSEEVLRTFAEVRGLSQKSVDFRSTSSESCEYDQIFSRETSAATSAATTHVSWLLTSFS